MRNIISAFIGIMFIGTAVAADVVERSSCNDIKSRIDTLSAQEELNDSDAALLSDLRASYRTKCTARAGGRGGRAIAAIRGGVATNAATSDTAASDTNAANTVAAPVDMGPIFADPCDNPDADGCCPGEVFTDIGGGVKYCCKDDVCFPPMDVAPAAPEKSEEEIAAEIAANIEKGLCSDGTKPNKYGCCDGEIFKDMGDATFACCKKDSTDCYPPIK